MIYQIHQNHGRHMAATPQEAEYNNEHGWKTITEAEFFGQKPVSQKKTDTVDDEERAELIKRYVAKFGERPHHRSGNAKILADLGE